MSLQGFEIISSNADLAILIYKLLDFNDQVSLSCVNVEMFNIFVKFIVKDAYKTLKVIRRSSEVLVTSGTLDTIAFLQPDVFNCFLECYGKNVQELDVRGCAITSDDDVTVPVSMLIDEERFKNLLSLRLVNFEIQQENLELVAQHCPNLQELQLLECIQPGPIDPCCLFGNMLMVGENISVSALKAIKHLKHLTIENTACIAPSMQYCHFWELIHQINLDSLELKVMLQPDREFHKRSPTLPHLKELSIMTCFDTKFWSVMLTPFLENFRNLVSLTITLTDFLSGATLEVLYDTLLNLEILNFEHIIFSKVHTFMIPRKVKELSLLNCSGLHTYHLRHMITQMRITKFSSKITRYKGDFEDFANSPIVEIFLIDGAYRPTHSVYIGNPTLKELTWEEGDTCYYEDDYAPDVPWKTCPNLRKLVLIGGFFPVASLLYLNHLTTLHVTIQDQTPLVEWSYIGAILKHRSLTELTVDSLCDDGKCLLGRSVPPVNGFYTSVKELTIPFEIFEAGLNYWLEILSLNRRLTLICNYFCKHRTQFLETLIWHNKFPKNISTIDVWGFIIRCQTLRDHFQDAMEKLVHQCKQLEPDVTYMDHLIIRKKR